jgi:hypothetical protein
MGDLNKHWGKDIVKLSYGHANTSTPHLIHIFFAVPKRIISSPSLFSFLFHGEGKAIGQQKKPIYNTPEPSMDSLPPSYNRRSSTSTSSGYNSQQTNLITSPATNYGSLSLHSETLPPTIQHPAGSLDQEGVEHHKRSGETHPLRESPFTPGAKGGNSCLLSTQV